jgi:hypothetical protein
MTSNQLIDEIPEDWRDCPILVNDDGAAVPVRRIGLITTDEGNRVIVIGGRMEKDAAYYANQSTK